jgi:hypothetical protein
MKNKGAREHEIRVKLQVMMVEMTLHLEGSRPVLYAGLILP